MHAYLSGFLLGLSLILAIGAQNAFVLKQGLKGEHVFWVVLTCALSDALLIGVGVSGFHVLVQRAPWLTTVSRYAGVAFLLWYGARSFRAALRSSAVLAPQSAAPRSLWQTLATTLAFTFLNPHVYLDTVVLLGSVSTQFAGHTLAFGVGATSASFAFFFSLGYGARLLRPLFARPITWKVLEALIGLTMWSLAARLLLGA
ncbi:MAG: amino acid transporter [Burkholderiaceae bacterium]|nr:amino acid transporter [Burkholderiaceae bacterium]